MMIRSVWLFLLLLLCALMVFGCATTENLAGKRVFYFNSNALSPLERVAFTPDQSMTVFFTAYREYNVRLKKGNDSEVVKYKEPVDFSKVLVWTPNTSKIFLRTVIFNKVFRTYELTKKVFKGENKEPQIEKIKRTFSDILEYEIDCPPPDPTKKGEIYRMEVEISPTGESGRSAFQRPLKASIVYVSPSDTSK